MTEPRQPLPTPRVRTRRLIEVDDAAPRAPGDAAPPPRPARTDGEGAFEYGQVGLNQNVAMRYRQIKALEGQGEAKAWAKVQIGRMLLAGVPKHEIAQTFQFSVPWTRMLIEEIRAERKADKIGGYDAANLVAEHMTTYQFIRENAFFVMQKTQGVTEMDRHRARESLLATMRQEIEFMERLGGMRGITLTAVQDDAATVAAKQMGDRLQNLLEQFAEADAAESVPVSDPDIDPDGGDDDTAYLPEEPGGGEGLRSGDAEDVDVLEGEEA